MLKQNLNLILARAQKDRAWMTQALIEAKKGSGKAKPNPSVGCVIVKNDLELSRGHTQEYGSIHAETHALSYLKNMDLSEATAYVTLEPCSHQGKQPPCVSALIKSGIKRVVIAIKDPNPLVSGKGIQALEDKNIDVTVGVCAKEATQWHSTFLMNQVYQRPIVVAKWAQTLNGLIADDLDSSQWISCREALHHSHQFRQSCDAILVGGNTAKIDFPQLTVRFTEEQPHHPYRIVFDPKNRVAHCTDKFVMKKYLTTTFSPITKTILFYDDTQPIPKDAFVEELAALSHVMLRRTKENIENILQDLGSTEVKNFLGRPIASILVEGGTQTLNQLMSKDLIDLFHIYISPSFMNASKNLVGISEKYKEKKSLSQEQCGKLNRMMQLQNLSIGCDVYVNLIPQNRANKIFQTGAQNAV